MKTLAITQYTCPKCKTSWKEEEWCEDHSPLKLLCDRCRPYNPPTFISSPNWVTLTKRIMPDPSKMDAKGEIRATDIMLEEREKEMKVSRRARQWEADRKKEFKKNVPYMKKDEAEKKQLKIDKIVREVTNKY